MKAEHSKLMRKRKNKTPETSQIGGTYLRAWRDHLGFAAEPVADELGISHASLTRMETGEQDVGVDMLIRIADLYEIPIDDLVRRPPPKPGEPITVTVRVPQAIAAEAEAWAQGRTAGKK